MRSWQAGRLRSQSRDCFFIRQLKLKTLRLILREIFLNRFYYEIQFCTFDFRIHFYFFRFRICSKLQRRGTGACFGAGQIEPRRAGRYSAFDTHDGTHIYRADVYMANRHFPEAREHWQKILDNYPEDSNIPKILFGIGRSYMWERDYEKAVFWFDKLFRDFTNTPDGRNGLNFKGASYVRWGKNAEAAETYKQYTVMFPFGEKVDSAYLNIIDCLREIGKYDEANDWVDKTTARFKGMPAEVNALHAKLRMEIHRQSWNTAVETADKLLKLKISAIRWFGLTK